MSTIVYGKPEPGKVCDRHVLDFQRYIFGDPVAFRILQDDLLAGYLPGVAVRFAGREVAIVNGKVVVPVLADPRCLTADSMHVKQEAGTVESSRIFEEAAADTLTRHQQPGLTERYVAFGGIDFRGSVDGQEISRQLLVILGDSDVAI